MGLWPPIPNKLINIQTNNNFDIVKEQKRVIVFFILVYELNQIHLLILKLSNHLDISFPCLQFSQL